MKSRNQLTIPGTWSTGRQLIRRAPIAHLLEATRRPAEEVALGRAPMLAVDAANSVPTAPEREPDRQTGQLRGGFRRGSKVSGSRTSESVSSSRRSGGSSAKIRSRSADTAVAGAGTRPPRRRRMQPRSGPGTASSRPHSARAGYPVRAISIQCTSPISRACAPRARCRRAPTRYRSRSRHIRPRRRSGEPLRPLRVPDTEATFPRCPLRPSSEARPDRPAGGSVGAPSQCRRRARRSARRRASARQRRRGGVPGGCSPSRSAHDTPGHGLQCGASQHLTRRIVVGRRTTVIDMEWGVPQRSFPVEPCGTPRWG